MDNLSAEEKYKDIINLPYQKSVRHPHMKRADRAAQFAPFAALTGFGEMINKVDKDREDNSNE